MGRSPAMSWQISAMARSWSAVSGKGKSRRMRPSMAGVTGSGAAFVEFGNGPADEEQSFDLVPPGSYDVKARGENEAGAGPESAVSVVVVT